jgi:hypothetical protein
MYCSTSVSSAWDELLPQPRYRATATWTGGLDFHALLRPSSLGRVMWLSMYSQVQPVAVIRNP